MQAFIVKRNADMTEGRGPMVNVAAFADEDVAWAFADLHPGVMGHRPADGTWRNLPFGDWTVESMFVHSNIEDYDRLLSTAKDSVRRQALNKLTTYERKLLGL